MFRCLLGAKAKLRQIDLELLYLESGIRHKIWMLERAEPWNVVLVVAVGREPDSPTGH